MSFKEWLDFPAFDFERWREEASNIKSDETGLWRKPYWSPSLRCSELPAKAIAPQENGNAWSLTESIQHEEDLMPALLGGADGIRFQHEFCKWQWLSKVHLEMIYLDLDADQVHLAHFPFRKMIANGWKGSCTRSVRGLTVEEACNHTDLLSAIPSIRKWAISTCDLNNPVEVLCSGLVQAQGAFDTFEAAGLNKAEAFQAFRWIYQVGPNVLEGVAMTRAMRIIWQRWLTSRGLKCGAIWLDARTYLPEVDEGLRTDRFIGMTSAAYSGAIGGVDSLEILPHDADCRKASADGKRWARNIQHLMREEAGLHRVFDPMGGSRVVEAWTAELVEIAWKSFENRVLP